MSEKLAISNYPSRTTIAYAELWARWPFRVHPWWAYKDLSYPAERKEDTTGLNVGYKYDVTPGPCWLVWEGTEEGGSYLFTLVRAANEDQLQQSPGPAFLPVYPGTNLVAFAEEPATPEPEPPTMPSPMPTPTPTEPRQARVLMYLPVGSPPFLVRPSAGEEQPTIKIIKTPVDHFERLWGMLPESLGSSESD